MRPSSPRSVYLQAHESAGQLLRASDGGEVGTGGETGGEGSWSQTGEEREGGFHGYVEGEGEVGTESGPSDYELELYWFTNLHDACVQW